MDVVYVAGYGRSGSTVLSIILGNHPQVVAVGELTFLLDEWLAPERTCSCGRAYARCEFWRDLFAERPSSELAATVRSVERLSSVPFLLRGSIRDDDAQAYQFVQKKVLDYVTDRAGKPVVVDSSKSARAATGRFLALDRLVGHDVYVLHLVRNGLATMHSLLVKGSNWAIEGYERPSGFEAVRAALGWANANVWASVLGRSLGKGRYLLLRYEDFLSSPAECLEKVGQFCGFDAGELALRVNNGDCFSVGHMVSGNRIRLKESIRLDASSGTGGPESVLKPHHRMLFQVVAGWLNRLYGYQDG